MFDSSTGTLTISGSGDISSYSYGSAPWYPYRSDVKKVVIEDGVTSIGEWVFDGCASLASVTIPDSVTSIGDYAFYGCTSLASVSIADCVTSIGQSAFSGCSSLVSMVVSEGNTVYCSVDGVLFSKDKKTLMQYPAGRSDDSYL